jgi:hypothetical protein
MMSRPAGRELVGVMGRKGSWNLLGMGFDGMGLVWRW